MNSTPLDDRWQALARPGLTADDREQITQAAQASGATLAQINSLITWSERTALGAHNLAGVLNGGLGIDRMTMIRHNIDDIRYLYENEEAFLRQF